MLKAESLIALGFMGLSAYFMWHATVLPIGLVPGQGPGGGAFPFWLSAIMLLASAGVLLRSLKAGEPKDSFFVAAMLRPVIMVTVLLIGTVVAMPIVGSYVALGAFMVSYLRVFGRHGWVLIGTLTTCTLLFLFFFFEVTLKILLPKGVTEPLFIPLYAIFF